MADKSPRKAMTKKAGKSLKEKRAAKRQQAQPPALAPRTAAKP